VTNKVVILSRALRPGAHSIEEIFTSLFAEHDDVSMLRVPEYKANVISICKNILFSIRNRGRVTHVTGDIHYVTLFTGKKTVLTIHDVGSLFKEGFVNRLLKKLFWIYLPSWFVCKITVISEFSKHELLKLAPWVKAKIVVIPNPVNPILEYKSKEFNITEPVILHLGTKSNKNLENTIKSLKGIECLLVIVGKLSNEQLVLLKENRIKFENYFDLPFTKIAELYYRCDIVSFLSFYEGFGMPVVEAQFVGRPIITSNLASIPEVAGKGAHYANPNDVEDMRAGFLKIIQTPGYRKELVANGLDNVKRFTIASVLSSYLSLYEEIM